MSVLDAMPSSNLKPENEGTRGRRGARGQGQELPMTPPPAATLPPAVLRPLPADAPFWCRPPTHPQMSRWRPAVCTAQHTCSQPPCPPLWSAWHGGCGWLGDVGSQAWQHTVQPCLPLLLHCCWPAGQVRPGRRPVAHQPCPPPFPPARAASTCGGLWWSTLARRARRRTTSLSVWWCVAGAATECFRFAAAPAGRLPSASPLRQRCCLLRV